MLVTIICGTAMLNTLHVESVRVFSQVRCFGNGFAIHYMSKSRPPPSIHGILSKTRGFLYSLVVNFGSIDGFL
jgi:hypothetical protein